MQKVAIRMKYTFIKVSLDSQCESFVSHATQIPSFPPPRDGCTGDSKLPKVHGTYSYFYREYE